MVYHHTVFCQTALPYRRPEERIWERSNGFIALSIEAGSVLDPEQRKWVNLPLPFGPTSCTPDITWPVSRCLPCCSRSKRATPVLMPS